MIYLQIEKYMEEIIGEMTDLMTKKIITQLKQETNYDLEFEKNAFDKKLKKVDFDFKYLNDFYNNEPTKNFDSKKILEILKFYDNSIETLKKDLKKLGDFKTIIETTNLFDLKVFISLNLLCEPSCSSSNASSSKSEKTSSSSGRRLNSLEFSRIFLIKLFITAFEPLWFKC